MPYNALLLNKWLDRAKEDFYSLFVKAWIPFNAWYNHAIGPNTNSGTDRECINYICRHNNTYKNKLLAFLRGNTREDYRFQQEMVDLHLALLRHQIPDATHPISFKTTTIFDDCNYLQEKDFYTIHYKIERIPKANGGGYDYDVKVVDKSTGGLKYSRTFNRWKMEDLESDADFAQFSAAVRNRLKNAFSAVYIKAPTNVIKQPVQKNDIGFVSAKRI